ncbi:MAG: ABC transporter substrate-binding protein [Deltaproteobacteria bacterium]|jgi:branched-chain amino acid transport system substrate-binding protein|nr:ABC transporter substrate-binding protein [Deltaproteobacteria bacterium]
MRKLWALIVCLGIFFCMPFTACFASAAKPIRIGIVDTYSGPASYYSDDVRDAFLMMVDKINSSGGILGHKVQVLTRDDKFRVDLGLSEAKELIMREHVNILMGTINSAVSLAVSDLCKKEKVPFLVTFGKSAKITGADGNHYVFSVDENTAMIGKAAAIALAKKPYTRYWIAGDDYEYGHDLADSLWKNLKKRNPKAVLLGQSWWKLGEPDFTPYISAILAAKPDCLIVATGGPDCVSFLKATKASGLNHKLAVYMHTAAVSIKPLGMDGPQGVLSTDTYYTYFPETAANKKFVAEFEKRYHHEPNAGALAGYLAAVFIQKAYKKAGAINTEKFIDALQGTSVASPVGKVTMRAFDHQVVLPMFVGVTKKEPGFKYLVASDIVTIPGKQIMPSIAGIKAARAKH